MLGGGDKGRNQKGGKKKKMNKKEGGLGSIEDIKADRDLIYLDMTFAAYILEQTDSIKKNALRIEHLVGRFKKETDEIPAGLVPSDSLIDKFSKTRNYLEKAYTGLSIELIRLKSIQMVQENIAYRMEQPIEGEPPEDVSFC